jgi:mannose-1-phosphate guanylyltransferase
MKAIILAGGGGSRLWPASREACPKQLRAVVGGRTMLRVTYDRLRRSLKPDDIVVATASRLVRRVREELPDLPPGNLIVESCRRDTAGAVGLALTHLSVEAPDDTFVIINSDAYVRDETEYARVLRMLDRTVKRHPDKTVLVGLIPQYPETGYGYIQTGRLVEYADGKAMKYPVHVARGFVEKPDLVTAKRYIASGDYLWNPALVSGRISHFLGLYRRHLPENAAVFERIAAQVGRRGGQAEIDKLFTEVSAGSLDYGILEKEKDLLVLPAGFGWLDIGHWRAVAEVGGGESDAGGEAPVIEIDSKNNLVRQPGGKLVALVGIEDLVIVDTPDALLVCRKDKAQEVKTVVAELKQVSELSKFL